jgi:hypothetical protein
MGSKGLGEASIEAKLNPSRRRCEGPSGESSGRGGHCDGRWRAPRIEPNARRSARLPLIQASGRGTVWSNTLGPSRQTRRVPHLTEAHHRRSRRARIDVDHAGARIWLGVARADTDDWRGGQAHNGRSSEAHWMAVAKQRDLATNRPRKMAGVDMRSGHGRRFADLYDGIAAEFPGVDPVAARELAGLKLTAELCQASVIAGDDKMARRDLVRTINLASRKEKELRSTLARVTGRASSPDLADYLAGRRRLVASAADRDGAEDDGVD